MSAKPLADAVPCAAAPLPASATPGGDLYATAALLAALLVAQHSSYASMLAIWQRSQTFAHGFIVLPISLWLLWRQRDELAAQHRRPSPLGLLVLAGLGVVWLLAAAANVSALQQYCVILMIPATVAAVLGWRMVHAAAFPLAYLLLAVPFGEVFITPLIDFTARFTVAALRLSGIPVYRDNNHFTLPSGSWDVIEACSGLRYVIASLALGTLFSYLTYRSTVRRLVFIAVSLALPVLANGMRAYLIVLIGHWSDMRLAAGIDHLVYGWLFFGLVSLLLFWCGAAWRDQPPATGAPPQAALPSAASAPVEPRHVKLLAYATASLALLMVWPLTARWLLNAPAEDAAASPLMVSDPPAAWHRTTPAPFEWQALHAGHPRTFAATYGDGRHTIRVQLTWYAHQTRGAELLTPVQPPLQADQPQWHEVASGERSIAAGGRRIPVRVTILQAGAAKLLIWRSYRVGARETASLQRVKWQLAAAKLLRQPDGGAELALSGRFDESPEEVESAMQRLLAAMLPAIDEGLRHARAR